MKESSINLLACPDCYGDMELAGIGLHCLGCGHKYEVRDGIPILLPKTIAEDKLLAIDAFGAEYRELLKNGYFEFEDKYSKKDVEIILAKKKEFQNYLEIGCGRGRNCIALAKKGLREVVGVDISIDALILAKKIAQKNGVEPFFICGDIMKLPIKKERFDMCFGGGSLEHFKETSKGIEQIYKILKKNGVSIMTVPCVSVATCMQGILTGNIPKIFPLKQVYYFLHYWLLGKKYLMFGFEYSFLPRAIEKDFRDAGFKDISSGLYDVDYDFKFIPRIFKKLAGKIIKIRFFWPMIKVVAYK